MADHAAVIFNNGVKLPLFGRIVVTVGAQQVGLLAKKTPVLDFVRIVAGQAIHFGGVTEGEPRCFLSALAGLVAGGA